MERKHAADRELPAWMSNLAEGKIIKQASPETEALAPYGMEERADQLGSQTFENFITELIREDEGEAKVDESTLEDDEKLKEMEKQLDENKEEKQVGPGGHIPDGTGPHGRGMGPGKGLGQGIIEEKQIEEKADDEQPEKDTPEEPKEEPPEEDIPDTGDSDLPPPEDAPEGETKDKGDDEAGKEMDELKKGLEDLGDVKELESRLKKIETLVENLQGPATADANINDSIFQSASIVSDLKRSNRIVRRVRAGSIERKDAIRKLNKIFSKF